MVIFVIYISVIIFFYKLLSFLIIFKGSWVALATSSAESPIASKRCAVSVLASCLPSALPSSLPFWYLSSKRVLSTLTESQNLS